MKKINYIVTGLGAAVFLLSLSACLKNDPQSANFSTVQPVIEQLNAPNSANNNPTTGANTLAYFMQIRVDSTHTATDSITVDEAGPLVGKDVTVTLGVDTADFNTFNAANGGAYVLLPAADYSWTNGNTTVIKAGVGEAFCHITFNTSLIDFTQNYILPISITDAQGQTISGNYGVTMYTIIPGNQYMGLYQSVGQRVEGSNTYTINDLKPLEDLSAIWVLQGSYPTAGNSYTGLGPQAFDGNQVVTNAADQSVYLSVGEQMDLTIVGNAVTVSNDNLYGFGLQTYGLISGPSTYNPATHTFTLSYGFIDPYNGDTSTVSEVMTRLE